MQELIDLLAGTRDTLEIDRAALAVASIEYPALDPGPYVQLLDSYAVELAGKLPEDCSGPQFVARANQFLFGELGFRGNTGDYYDPRNSCLNEVLASRTGIPLTLSIVYIEIARRLAKPVQGIGLPGHFLVRYASPEYSTFIDPFHGGRLLSPEACYELAKQMTGVDYEGAPGALAAAGKRHILVRMLNNLRGIYLNRSMDRKAISVLTLLLAAAPDSPDEYKQRGILRLRQQQYAASVADLERYVALAPEASDCAEIKGHLERLRQCLAALN